MLRWCVLVTCNYTTKGRAIPALLYFSNISTNFHDYSVIIGIITSIILAVLNGKTFYKLSHVNRLTTLTTTHRAYIHAIARTQEAANDPLPAHRYPNPAGGRHGVLRMDYREYGGCVTAAFLIGV